LIDKVVRDAARFGEQVAKNLLAGSAGSTKNGQALLDDVASTFCAESSRSKRLP